MNRWISILGAMCDKCPLCVYARNNPEALVGRIMHWHGKWCPAWKAQKLWSEEEELKKKQHPDAP